MYIACNTVWPLVLPTYLQERYLNNNTYDYKGDHIAI